MNEPIVDNIINKARTRGMSLKSMCRRADISYESFRLMRRDPSRDILVSTIVKLARALDVQPATLMRGVK